MKTVVSLSAVAKDPVAAAKKVVADCASQIKALQKQMDTAQSVIDKEAARVAKTKADAEKLRAATVVKNHKIKFMGIKQDGREGNPNTITKAAQFASPRGRVYALNGEKKTLVAFWNSSDALGHPIKGFMLHFTPAGKKYQPLYVK